MGIRRIEPQFRTRIWGVDSLAPYFEMPPLDKPEDKIGEVWFEVSAECALLVKFLFTEKSLSVQVHPDDEYAGKHERSRGKTEMWHILSAKPDAKIALGFREPQTEEQIREAIDQNVLDKLLEWVPVKAGDTFFAEAGVVHAIGAGITLVEIQQNSDVTYRFFDYGSGRPLHIEQAFAVAELDRYDGRRELPVTCQHFTTDLVETGSSHLDDSDGERIWITLEGSGAINGERFGPGQAWHVEEGSGPVKIVPDGEARLLRTQC